MTRRGRDGAGPIETMSGYRWRGRADAARPASSPPAYGPAGSDLTRAAIGDVLVTSGDSGTPC